jgi:predicted dehydrogenase
MTLSRRQVIKAAIAAAAAGPTIVPRHVLGGPKFVPPSEKVNVALVGAGGQGRTNLKNLFPLEDVQVIALADPIESVSLEKFYFKGMAGRGPIKQLIEETYSKKTPNFRCNTYVDFRELLAKEKAVDAVLCATPDHLHAYVTATSMRAGKHVYCEKPLTHNIAEARFIAKLAKETGLATQMGNNGHSTDGIRQTVEYVRAGAIGTIREACAWVGTKRWNPTLTTLPEPVAPPSDLNWDLWVGPRKMRPYNPAYVPVAWRDFWDFGCGALGDFGCHDLDAITWAFDLHAPTSIESQVAGYSDPELAPHGEICYYEFPGQGSQPPLKVTFYSGGLKPQRHPALGKFELKSRGVMFIGDKGVIQCDGAGGAPRLFPDELRASFKAPEPTLKRSKGHHRDWIDAIKGGEPASSNFDYATRLTEITLLGVMATRLRKKFTWDAANMKTDAKEADAMIHGFYRPGWEVA